MARFGNVGFPRRPYTSRAQQKAHVTDAVFQKYAGRRGYAIFSNHGAPRAPPSPHWRENNPGPGRERPAKYATASFVLFVAPVDV